MTGEEVRYIAPAVSYAGFMRTGQQPDPDEANKKARYAAWARVL
jgi:hypothetical protein